MIKTLDDIPIIASYLKRIGAEAINFKSATVTKMVGGYPKVTGWVRFSIDGTVEATGTAEGPTEAEAIAIAEAISGSDFPKPVALVHIDTPPPGVDMDSQSTFICHDFAGHVVMIHQRYQTQDGGKGFIPWTRWTDGEWRKMEPEVMPFYGLPGREGKNTLFIHEGAKAAKKVQRILAGEDSTDFPWADQMRFGHHIGWIGGVHALARSDWEKLAAQGWRRVIIVADNDSLGRAIVPDISKHFNVPVFVIGFTDDWPDGFDLGDEWPKEMFGDEGQYIGPSYEQCLQPATWATDEIILPARTPRGQPQIIHTIRHVFSEQWAWIEEQDVMVNLSMPHYKMAAAKFNGFIRPFSDSKETFQLFQKKYTGNQMRLTYDPSRKGIVVRDSEGLQAINQYQPSPIRPVRGDYSPFINFMEYLIPNERDRKETMRWIATLRARPDVRMIYGLLLMSERQGTGKGTLARILADLVGRHNASFPSAGLITGSEFNGWASGKRLIIVDEIYEGHSWKAYNKLKPFVTDDTIEINVKFQATWTMPNWTHYMLMSNSFVALKLEEGDRRWLVPKVQEAPWEIDRFIAFNRWLRRGGIAAIAFWAHNFEDRGEGRYVTAGEIAPTSENKVRLIEESRSDAEILLMNLAQELVSHPEPVAIPLTGLKQWVSDRLKGQVFETPQSIGRIMKKHSCYVTERIKIGATKMVLIVNNQELQEASAGQLKDILKTPDTFIPEEI
jgi:hypothetical protein